MLKNLLILLALTSIALAEDKAYNFQCGDIFSEDTAIRVLADTEYIKGDKMFLCLHFAPFGIRIPYQIVVDEYNMIEVKHCKFPLS